MIFVTKIKAKMPNFKTVATPHRKGGSVAVAYKIKSKNIWYTK